MAEQAALPVASGSRPVGHGRPARRRRFELDGRRPRPSAGFASSPRRPPSPSAISRSIVSPAGGRRSPRSSTIRISSRTCARCAASPWPTRRTKRCARLDQHRETVYHVAWLASRLGLRIVTRCIPSATRRQAAAGTGRVGREGTGRARPRCDARDGRTDIGVVVRPVTSPLPAGTTLRVELLADRRGSSSGPMSRRRRRRSGSRCGRTASRRSTATSQRPAVRTSTCSRRRSRRAAATGSRLRRSRRGGTGRTDEPAS